MTIAKTPHLDRSFFAVMVDHTRAIGQSLVERDLRDSRAQIIRDIVSGEYHRVVAVMEFNPVEGWASDISADMAQAVVDAHADDDTWTDCAIDFVETYKPELRDYVASVRYRQDKEAA